MRFRTRKTKQGWAIIKNSKIIDYEISKSKAKEAIDFYKGYYKKPKRFTF